MATEDKRKKPLQKRDFDIVVEGHVNDGDYDITFARVKASLDSASVVEGVKFWTIEHDTDFEEDGTLKRRHIHIVLRFPTRHTQNAVVTFVSTIIDCPRNVVSVYFATPLWRRIRYLMHLDELGKKTIYPIDRVVTNDRQTLLNAYNSDSDEVTPDYLISLVKSYERKADVLSVLGVSAYTKYRYIINDLWNEKGNL